MASSSLYDTKKAGNKAALGYTDAQASAKSNSDMERIVRGIALSLTGTALAKKSINDLRILSGVQAADA